MRFLGVYTYSLFAFFFGVIRGGAAEPVVIKPGEIWPDDRGQHIQAHGGGVIKLGNEFFWFGEDRSKTNKPNFRYVACYSSEDLAHWRFRAQVVQAEDPAKLGPGWVLERPKVFYNAKTQKYVMYAHIDDHAYKAAEVAVFTCERVDGNYQYVKSFRPLQEQSRDIGQFIDDDGAAYLIFEDRAHGSHIASLSPDYLDVVRDIHLFAKEIGGALEGGALAHYKGLYYYVGSRLSGWSPNPNQYATAENLAGPWSSFKDIAPPAAKTYGAQSTMLLKISGTKAESVIFMADFWKPATQWDSRYLWMPLQIDGPHAFLPAPKPWSIEVHTGEVSTQP